MYCTFIVVDNNVSEMRFWNTKENAEKEFEHQCELTANYFGYELKEEYPSDVEAGLVKKNIYVGEIYVGEKVTECVVYLMTSTY